MFLVQSYGLQVGVGVGDCVHKQIIWKEKCVTKKKKIYFFFGGSHDLKLEYLI